MFHCQIKNIHLFPQNEHPLSYLFYATSNYFSLITLNTSMISFCLTKFIKVTEVKMT